MHFILDCDCSSFPKHLSLFFINICGVSTGHHLSLQEQHYPSLQHSPKRSAWGYISSHMSDFSSPKHCIPLLGFLLLQYCPQPLLGFLDHLPYLPLPLLGFPDHLPGLHHNSLHPDLMPPLL